VFVVLIRSIMINLHPQGVSWSYFETKQRSDRGVQVFRAELLGATDVPMRRSSHARELSFV